MEITTDTGSVVINPDERFVLMMWYTVNGRGASRSALFREITASDEDIVKLVSQSICLSTTINFDLLGVWGIGLIHLG